MATLTTWMNNVRVGTLTRQANGAHSFRYDDEWLRSPRARPLSLSLPLQYGNITADAVYHYFDNLLPDSPQVRDRIVRRYQARSKQPFDLLAEVGRDSVGAVTLLPPGEEVARRISERHELLTEFFVRLGVSREVAAADACKIEHDLSEETFQKIKQHAGKLGEG